MAGKSSIRWTDESLFKNVETFDSRAQAALSKVTTYYALRAETHVKTRAPWTDRSGNARSGLSAQPFTESNVYRVVVYHSVTYGKWLEIRWGGRWGIIQKSVRELTPEYTAMMTQAIQQVMAGR